MTWLNTVMAFTAGFMTCLVGVFIAFIQSTVEVEKHNRQMADELAEHLDRLEKVERREVRHG